eukprot:scaffold4582_cov56-Attheya_sp.AAC.5
MEEPPEDDASSTGENTDVSRNIPLVLAYTFLAFAGRSLWSQSVLSAFVFLLSHDDPKVVGYLTALMGVMQLVASLPAGIAADSFASRDSLLRLASAFGILAIFVSVIVCTFHPTLVGMGVALSLWGVYWGISNTIISALFADSIQDGDRSHYFTQRQILVKIGMTTGPTVALALFFILGDEWTIHDCATVMTVGQVVCAPAVLLVCFLSDSYTIPHYSSSGESSSSSSQDQDFENKDESHIFDGIKEPLLGQQTVSSIDIQSSPTYSSSLSVTSSESSHHEDDDEDDQKCCCLRQMGPLSCCGKILVSDHRVVPCLVALSDLMSGLASGMSIRYFPIFFLNDMKLSPMVVQILYIASPLTQTVLSKVAHWGGRRLGRCQMAVMYKYIGISFLACMIGAHVGGLPRAFVCVLFVARTSFMNSTGALTKSVLMDAVPRHERGKWSALESVNMFSWSGSAALGGILVGMEGILFNFCITGSLQVLATVPLLFLFCRVPSEQSIQRQKEERDNTTV